MNAIYQAISNKIAMFYDTPASWSSPFPATYSKGLFSSHTLQESPPSAFEWHAHLPSATLKYKRWEEGR